MRFSKQILFPEGAPLCFESSFSVVSGPLGSRPSLSAAFEDTTPRTYAVGTVATMRLRMRTRL